MPPPPLTPEQLRSLAQWREDWFSIGTAAEPADRLRAEAAIAGMYEVAGHPAPRFLWTGSPAELLQVALQHSLEVAPLTRDALRSKGGAFDHTGRSLGDSLGASLGSVLWDGLQQSMGTSLRATLDDAVGEYLHAALWRPLEDWVERAIWRPLRDWLGARDLPIVAAVLSSAGQDAAYAPVLAQRMALLLAASGRRSVTFTSDATKPFQLRWAFAGQHDVYWVAFFAFCEQVLGARYAPDCSRRLGLWADLCHSGWWAPYQGYCICAERPSAVRIERQGTSARLHNEQGPALEFRDGTRISAVHGVVS